MARTKVEEKIRKTPEMETLYFPLYVRARDAGSKTPVIRDPKAVEILRRLELNTSISEVSPIPDHTLLTRTLILDKVVEDFIRKCNGVIINLGAGLDTRFFRLDNGKVRWYDLDSCEVIALRRKFLKESERVRFIAISIFDEAWAGKIPIQTDEPVLIIAEGLFMYHSETEIQTLFARLARHYPESEVYFDVIHSRLVGKGNNNLFRWGLDKAAAIEKLHPRIQLMEHWNIKDFHSKRVKLFYYLATLLQISAKKRLQILRVKFKP
jgi:O-methyltransferase involved in polyketide biosynthesis